MTQSDPIVHWLCERWLSRVMDQFGAAGLAAATADPGLLAMIDQHAAAVRDVLRSRQERSATAAGVVLLAGYARGLLDRSGTDLRRVSERLDGRWPDADWLTLRLLGVCALSRVGEWQLPMPRVG